MHVKLSTTCIPLNVQNRDVMQCESLSIVLQFIGRNINLAQSRSLLFQFFLKAANFHSAKDAWFVMLV